MNKQQFEQLISSLTDKKIKIFVLENQDAKKWYDKKYIDCATIQAVTTYGISYDGLIQFEFKSTKDEDGFLKSFINQYCSKAGGYEIVDGELVKMTKESHLNKIVKANSDRVQKGLFYTTLYGIGLWDFFCGEQAHNTLESSLSEYLTSKGIKWSNEYSEARWVYRFKFQMDIEDINQLLNEYKGTDF
jgi:hypothetical protein